MARRRPYRRRNPSGTTTALIATATALVGGAVGYAICHFALGMGTFKLANAARDTGELHIGINGSTCHWDDTLIPCVELVQAMALVRKGTTIRLYVEQGSQGVVEQTVARLEAAGYTVEIIEQGAPP